MFAPKKIIVSVLILLITPLTSLFAGVPANETGSSSDTSFERSLVLSLDYGSNKVFLNRTTSTNLVYLASSVLYEASSGFFVSIAPYFLLSPQQHWDELDLNFGWDFFLFKKRLEASVSYTRFVFNSNSIQLRDSLNNNLELILRKNFKALTSRLFFDFDFGHGNNDHSFTWDNSHDFVFEHVFDDDDIMKIKPMISISAGTLNFYRVRLKDPNEKPSLQNLTATANTKFNFTGIEFSLPLEYDIGRFSIEPAIHYNIPLNQPRRLNATATTYFTASLSFAIL